MLDVKDFVEHIGEIE